MSRSRVTEGPAIAALPKRHDSLLVLDLDEVVLHFVAPFQTLLSEHGARLHFDSFALVGNVRSIATGVAVAGPHVSTLTQQLYAEQERRQRMVTGAAQALARLAEAADILFLTAMTPRFYAERRRLLNGAGLTQPMIATERAKGALIAEAAERWRGPIVFVDDLPPNLAGARRNLERVKLVHLMANRELRPHLPPLPPGAHGALEWADAEPMIARLLNGATTASARKSESIFGKPDA